MKHMLCSTAIALFLAAPLSAQETTTPGADTGMTAPAMGGETVLFMPGDEPGDVFASDLIGMAVYSSDTDYSALTADGPVAAGDMQAWDNIGDINDAVISESGEVRALLVDIGGFLGLGARTVALDMAQVHLLSDETGARFVAVTSTREQLEAAPEFERTSMEVADTAAGGATGIATPTAGVAPDATPSSGTRPMLARDGFTEIDYATLTADELDGATVQDVSDNTIGQVSDVVLKADGAVEGAVIDVGGFLGLGAHPVMVSFEEMQIMRRNEGDEIRVFIDDTREELEQRPEYVQG